MNWWRAASPPPAAAAADGIGASECTETAREGVHRRRYLHYTAPFDRCCSVAPRSHNWRPTRMHPGRSRSR